LRDTVTLINTTAYGAGSGSVARVNSLNHNPHKLGFVLDKRPQLVESPRVLLPPLALANRYPVTDTAEVFQGDTPASAFSLCNNTLADSVVDIRGKTSLFARTLSEKPLGLLRPFGLELALEFSMSLPKPVDLCPRVSLPVRVGDDINDAEVNTKKTVGFVWRRLWRIYHNSKVEDAVSEDKVGLPNLTVKPRFLIGTDSGGDNQPAIKRENGDFIEPLPRQDTLVKNHRRMWAKLMLGNLTHLVAFRYLSYRTDCHLRRETKPLSQLVVDKPMYVELPESLSLERHVRSVIAGLIKGFHSLNQSFVLLWRRCEFYHQCLFHVIAIIEQNSLQCQGRRWLLLPVAETTGCPKPNFYE